MSSLQGKVALVTGGAHGIGFGIVSKLISKGASVVIADINAERGQEAVDKIKKENPSAQVIFTVCDVASWPSQVGAFTTAVKTFKTGRIDLVFANAGIAELQGMRDRSPKVFASSDNYKRLETLADEPPSMRVINVNLTGALYTIHAALAFFRAQEPDKYGKKGKIVVTGSNAMIYAFPCDTLYGTAKTGLLGAVRALAPRLQEEGITINALAPALVDTGLPLPDTAYERKLVTPMETITSACEIFYKDGSEINGQIAECCLDRIVMRKFPGNLNDQARQCMNYFWDQDSIDATLNDVKGQDTF